eukprot:3928536-Lingulodinium_polyedra.AAC.1
MRGIGLVAFAPDAPGSADPLPSRPLLCLHYDEASSNLSLIMWMVYKAQMRVFPCRDIFHRQWNDTQLAVKQAGLW